MAGMPWWAWLGVAGVVAVLVTRKWNPVSRAAAAGEIGRRYAVLIHFWRIWVALASVGVVGVAALIATHPAPSPARVATPPHPVASAPVPSPTASPVASPAAVATQASDGHIPDPVLVIILICIAVVVATVVATWRRRREDDPEFWLATHAPYIATDPDLFGDAAGGYETGGWVAGNAPDPEHLDDPIDDTEDTDDDHPDDDPDPADEQGGDGRMVGGGPVRHLDDRRRRRPRHPRVPGR